MGWINIKKRLPNPEQKDEREVLILTNYKEREKVFVSRDGVTDQISFFSDMKVWGIESITHWIHLPELPKVDEE
jgi:hypothetical protein